MTWSTASWSTEHKAKAGMCIPDPITVALPPPCHRTGAHWRRIADGRPGINGSAVLAACTACGRRYRLVLAAEALDKPPTPPRPAPTRRRHTAEQITELVRRVDVLRATGVGVKAACTEVGIERSVYYSRRPAS